MAVSFSEISNQIKKLKQELITQIQELPDNPKINRVAESPRCFIIMSSDMDNNWSPEYHDFKTQYEKIVEKIETSTIENVEKLMKLIIEDGKIKESNGQYFVFHPDVRKFVSDLIKPSNQI